jgi:CelD/BcsL family acetyltransferase involved in cellulose biosynthesis
VKWQMSPASEIADHHEAWPAIDDRASRNPPAAAPDYYWTSVVVAENAAALSRFIPAWEELAAEALEPNVFHEHWMLLPAVQAFARGKDTRFVLILVHDKRDPLAAAKLGALFPLEHLSRYRGFPFRHLTLWQHPHCFLSTPLVRRNHARECLAAFLEWLARNPQGEQVMAWRDVAADGPFFRVLADVLNESGQVSFLSERHGRALLRPRADGEAYLAEALPGKSLKEFRRLARRLAESGPAEYVELRESDDAGPWIKGFLELEASGWRGRGATALDSTPAGRRFFTSAATGAARRGRLMMLGLRVDGRFVAMKCNLLAGDGAFAFKIAFDERYRRFSPGALLELENIRRFHARPGLRWMDSCAAPEHFMANRLWIDRRGLATLMTAKAKILSGLVVSSLPLLRRLYRSLPRPAAASS